MAFPDAWEETAFVSITKLDGSEIQYMTITESIDINVGDNPGESIPTVSGGRLWKRSPQEDGQNCR